MVLLVVVAVVVVVVVAVPMRSCSRIRDGSGLEEVPHLGSRMTADVCITFHCGSDVLKVSVLKVPWFHIHSPARLPFKFESELRLLRSLQPWMREASNTP